MKVHAPPLDDNDYNYIQKTLPGQNTLYFGPGKPTRLMLPIVPMSAGARVRGAERASAPTRRCAASPGS